LWNRPKSLFLTKSLLKYCNIFNKAFRAGETPTPQENLLFVEQAEKPVPDEKFAEILQDF